MPLLVWCCFWERQRHREFLMQVWKKERERVCVLKRDRERMWLLWSPGFESQRGTTNLEVFDSTKSFNLFEKLIFFIHSNAKRIRIITDNDSIVIFWGLKIWNYFLSTRPMRELFPPVYDNESANTATCENFDSKIFSSLSLSSFFSLTWYFHPWTPFNLSPPKPSALESNNEPDLKLTLESQNFRPFSASK